MDEMRVNEIRGNVGAEAKAAIRPGVTAELDGLQKATSGLLDLIEGVEKRLDRACRPAEPTSPRADRTSVAPDRPMSELASAINEVTIRLGYGRQRLESLIDRVDL